MPYKTALIIFLFSILTGCAQSQNCIDNINKLPMYGKLNNIKKCKEQLQNDADFIAAEDKISQNRKAIAQHFVMRGWEFLKEQKLDTAMMRFNQAWLLDSLNYQVYWGYADILGMQKKAKESLPYFEMAIKLNSKDARLFQDVSIGYGNVFFNTKDKKYLNSTIFYLNKAKSLDPKNPQIYSQLTFAYTYKMQKDNALKYLKITDSIDPNTINPEVRQVLKNTSYKK